MTSNPFLPDAGWGVLFIILYVVIWIAVVAISLRILYAVIWRAVRRGLKEYHKDNPGVPTP
ncbi:MAG TPA: hypothetical protein VHZ81_05645 [Galbitalea sp.]|jgi:hypothetical protein|nr:hypothetical protein [Galbitalea sp.]